MKRQVDRTLTSNSDQLPTLSNQEHTPSLLQRDELLGGEVAPAVAACASDEQELLRSQVLRRVDALLPAIAEQTQRTDKGRRVPNETIQAFKNSGLLNILVPKCLGGLESDFSTYSAITHRLATVCGSTAWVYAVLAEPPWITTLFPKQAQDEIWAENPVVCASIVPFGKAKRVDGGYRISGKWGFLSGSDHANWVILSANADVDLGRGPVVDLLVRKSDVNMLDDWHVLGLAGTGSHGCIVDDLFVPQHRAIPHAALMDGTAPGREVHPDYLLGRVPRGIVTAFSLTPVIVGLATHALRIVTEMLRHPAPSAMPDWVAVQSKFAQATVDVDLANLILTTYGPRTDQMIRSGHPITELDITHTRLSASRMTRLAQQAIDNLTYICGSKWLYDDHPLQLIYRDAEAAATHRSYNWEMASTAYCSALGLGRSKAKN